jgi:hypothetical protein
VSRWAHARAALIAIAIALGLVEGCPLPPPDKTPAWERGFVEPIRTAQQVVLRPVAWIGRRLRISQQWALYQAPAVDKFRLWIDGRDAAGRWHLVYRASDPEHAEDEELIDYTRPRGVWDPVGGTPPMQYPLFARWMTQRVLDRHPEYVAARVQLERVTLTRDGLEPTGTFAFPHILLRADADRSRGRALR